MNRGQPSSLISSYRRRQQRGPIIVWGLAGVLVVVGIIVLILWINSSGGIKFTLFSTATPTPTQTLPPTNTFPPSATPTETMTPTQSVTPTASAPFHYIVQEGDSLFAIAQKFGLGDDGIQLLLLLNPYDEKKGRGVDPTTLNLIPGQDITVPNPGMALPTATPVPSDLPRGTKIDYTVRPGDNLAGIASLFNSTIEDIVSTNKITDPNKLGVGDHLTIHVNLVTPTPTRIPTTTPIGTAVPTAINQPTPTP